MLDSLEPHLMRSAFVRRGGESDRRLARAAEAGELTRIRRGAYALRASWTESSPEKRHLLRVIATGAAARSSPVFSHESAALAWGLPVVGGIPDRPQITVPVGSGLRSNNAVVRREAPLHPSEVSEVSGIRLTNLARTIVDVMATRSFLSGACAAEHALAIGALSRADLIAAVEARRPFRGSRKAEDVVSFASELSASPNETLCRVSFRELGFEQPEQQRSYSGSHREKYHVDFYWPEQDVIGETDGRVKYEDPRFLRGRTAQQALWDEKVREDELRAQCRGFVRLTWDDAWNRAGLVAKLARAGIPRHR
jgi:hypothetical protein